MTPATNAIAAVMLLITLTILLVGQWLLNRNARRTGASAQVGGVAGIVAENAAEAAARRPRAPDRSRRHPRF